MAPVEQSAFPYSELLAGSLFEFVPKDILTDAWHPLPDSPDDVFVFRYSEPQGNSSVLKVEILQKRILRDDIRVIASDIPDAQWFLQKIQSTSPAVTLDEKMTIVMGDNFQPADYYWERTYREKRSEVRSSIREFTASAVVREKPGHCFPLSRPVTRVTFYLPFKTGSQTGVDELVLENSMQYLNGDAIEYIEEYPNTALTRVIQATEIVFGVEDVLHASVQHIRSVLKENIEQRMNAPRYTFSCA